MAQGKKKTKRRLGRGLSSLIGDPVRVPVPAQKPDPATPETATPAPDAPAASTPKALDPATESAAATAATATATTAATTPAGVEALGSPPDSEVDAPDQQAEWPVVETVSDRTEQRTEHEQTERAVEANPNDAGGGAAPSGGLHLIERHQLIPNRRQPRTHFDEAALVTLADSIRTAGMMQPIVARRLATPVETDSGATATLEIIAGERRYRAAGRAGLDRVPVIIRDVDDRTAAEWALVENVQREDLDPIERAIAFRRLADEFEMTHEAIASAVGLDRASVSNHLRLLALEPAILDLVRQRRLGMGHARALLPMEEPDDRAKLAESAARDGWSVRELERRVRAAKKDAPDASKSGAAPATAAIPDAARVHLDDLERRLGDHLGNGVQIRTGRKKGTGELRIQFFSFEEFEGILDRLGFKPE